MTDAALDETTQRAVRKAAWRLIPLLCVAYIISYIDRTNVGFAALDMNAALGLTAKQFGFAAGMFSIGYCLFELPSNVALQRFGARRWLARIMVTWGIAAAATAFATGPVSYSVIRFITGVAEAGFYPGAIFYIATWFPVAVRGRILAWFVVAVPLSSVISGPVSTALLKINGLGLVGWQWLFIIEGLPACVMGAITLFALADRPEDAKWLTDDEQRALRAKLESEAYPELKKDLWSALADARVLVLSLAYLFFVTGSVGAGIWLPQILKPFGLSNQEVGFVSAIPYIAGSIALILWSYALDRSRAYLKNYVIGCIVSGLGFLFSVLFDNLWLAVAGVSVGLIGMSGARPAIFCIPPRFLSGAAAAGGIALINSFGNLGGFMGPYAIGWLRETTGSFNAALYFLAGSMVLSALLALSVRLLKVKA
ncbi:MAG: MFS transporter [Proteobacteria bacterium]|nr:MFS transporter [Pseudomonadota bacterium]